MSSPKYLYIADKIKEKINNKEFLPGDTLPSESKLQEIFGVSRYTVRQALDILTQDGLVVSKKGSGTFVNKKSQTNNKIVGVITTYITDYIFPSIISGIESTLSEQNISLQISCTNNNFRDEKQALELMLENKIDALIIEPTMSNTFNPNIYYYAKLIENNIPIISINAKINTIKCSSVTVDDYKAGYIATEHLIKKGHKDILLITKTDDKQGDNRASGFINAHIDYGIPLKKNFLINYTTEQNNLNELLQKSNFDDFTAAVCYNDMVALELYGILKNNGYSVPDDISIVSHDDSILSQTLGTPLTSIAHPKEKLGIKAAQWVIDTLSDTKYIASEKSFEYVFEPNLVERDSVKKIN